MSDLAMDYGVFDAVGDIPLINDKEATKIEAITEEVSGIKSLITTISTSLSDYFKTEKKERDKDRKDEGKASSKPADRNSPIGSKKGQRNFFQKLSDTIGEKVAEATKGFRKMGQESFATAAGLLLGPLQVVAKPFEDIAGVSLIEALTPPPFRGAMNRSNMKKKDPGAVYVADAITGKKEKQKKSFIDDLFGKEGFLGGLLKNVGPILAKTGLIALFAGLTFKDIFGPGGATEFFKKGQIGRGIFTALFGVDLSEKSTLQKALGIGMEGLKWGALGFALYGPLGGLIGLGIGATGAAIKLGVDSGFFEKIWGKTKEITKIAKEWVEKTFIEPFRRLFKAAKDVPILGLFLESWDIVYKFFKGWFDSFVTFFRTVFQDPGKAFIGLGKDIINIFKDLALGLWDYLKRFVLDPIEIGKALGGLAVDIFNLVKGIFTDLIGQLSKSLKDFVADPKTFALNLVESIQKMLNDVVKSVFGFLGEMVTFFEFLASKNIFEMVGIIAGGNFGKEKEIFKTRQQAEQDTVMRSKIQETREYNEQIRKGKRPEDALENAVRSLAEELVKAGKPINQINQTLVSRFNPENMDNRIFGK